MRRVRHVFLTALAGATAGCAAPVMETISPDQIPGLEAKRSAHANDPTVLATLGEAYYSAGRYGEAESTLVAATRLDAQNTTAVLYLAFTFDTLAQYPDARERYEAVRATRPAGGVARVVDDRLRLLQRKEAVVRARAALAGEATLSAEPPPAGTIAVLPLQYAGADTSLAPLGRGLAEVMVTDLATVSRLRLVERVQIQALLDELALSGSGHIDSASAARSGRLLRAARVLAGTINDAPDSALRLDASVVDATASTAPLASTATSKLDQLFDMEKAVVLDVLRQMGITLSPAEQARIAERPTRSLLAFLAYSRGLESADQGEFGAAAQSFTEARRIDPAFSAAFLAAQNAQRLSTAASAKPSDLSVRLVQAEVLSGRARLRETIAHVAPGAGDFADRLANTTATTTDDRKGIQESTNSQGPTTTATGTTIIITVKRP